MEPQDGENSEYKTLDVVMSRMALWSRAGQGKVGWPWVKGVDRLLQVTGSGDNGLEQSRVRDETHPHPSP